MSNAANALKKLENNMGKKGIESFIGEKDANAIREACGTIEAEDKTPAKQPEKKEAK